MSQISKVLRAAEGGVLLFWCPGCDGAHSVQHGVGHGPRWHWDGNAERPTFDPSILVRWPDYQGRQDNPVQHVCHSFVRAGRIQFLDDCTHALAGQTVDLAEWDAP